jgi:hypothetical protein
LKEKLTGGKKKWKGKGNFFHEWTCWVGDVAKDSQKICSGFCILWSEAREQDSEFLSAIDISPLTILQRLSHSPIQNKTKQKKTQPFLALHGFHPSFILFSIQGSPTKLCSQQHQVLIISQIPSSTP